MSAAPDSPLATLWLPSPNHGVRLGGRRPDSIILHYTGMEEAESALDWLTREESQVSCHYLVDEAGRVAQMVAEERRAWHAGVASWHGDTDMNSCSIGIEIHNPGHDRGYPAFPDAQIAAVEALCRDIMGRNGISRERFLAHSDIAPARKQDPGEKFMWDRLARAGVGLWVDPDPPDGGPAIGLGDEGDHVKALQVALTRYGYALEPTGTFGKATEQVVTAFQRHFRPARVDGRADASTRSALDRVLAVTAAIA